MQKCNSETDTVERQTQISDLNEYALLNVFQYCDDKDLENLYRVCKQFRFVIENRIYYRKSFYLLLCGHFESPEIIDRTQNYLTYRKRLTINSNWIDGRYHESVYFKRQKIYAAKLFLERDYLYTSHGGYLRIYKRLPNEPVQRKHDRELVSSVRSDISHFVKKNDTIFAGRICGSCFVYEDDYLTEEKRHKGQEYLNCVDFIDNVYVTATQRCCRVWQRSSELGMISFELMKEFKDAFMTVKLFQQGEKMVAGMYFDKDRHALREIDVETGTFKILNSNSISIYDIKMKDPNTIYAGHFDTTCRLYDRRTDQDELIWSDPFDSSVYCLDHDGLYGILCGMKNHCRVNLYDVRMPQRYVQMYFPSLRKTSGSPVYSLACDSQYMFIATDLNMRVLDFDADWAPNKDYRGVFVNVK